MMSIIRIPVPLRKLVGGSEEINTFGQTVEAALIMLCLSYPELKDRIFDEEENIRKFLNIYLNDEDIRFLESTDLKEGDVISIVPALAGG